MIHYIRWNIPVKYAVWLLCLLYFGGVVFNRYNQLFCSLFIVIALKASDLKSCPTFISKISRNSYGIYLLHSPLIYITFKYFGNCSPFIVVCLNLLFGFSVYLLTSLIRTSKLRIAIGE